MMDDEVFAKLYPESRDPPFAMPPPRKAKATFLGGAIAMDDDGWFEPEVERPDSPKLAVRMATRQSKNSGI